MTRRENKPQHVVVDLTFERRLHVSLEIGRRQRQLIFYLARELTFLARV